MGHTLQCNCLQAVHEVLVSLGSVGTCHRIFFSNNVNLPGDFLVLFLTTEP